MMWMYVYLFHRCHAVCRYSAVTVTSVFWSLDQTARVPSLQPAETIAVVRYTMLLIRHYLELYMYEDAVMLTSCVLCNSNL